jgi:hypothetical protein
MIPVTYGAIIPGIVAIVLEIPKTTLEKEPAISFMFT